MKGKQDKHIIMSLKKKKQCMLIVKKSQKYKQRTRDQVKFVYFLPKHATSIF